MKPVHLKLPFSINELLNNVELLSTEELKSIADKITQLIQRKNNTPENREAHLRTIILRQPTPAFLKRYDTLSQRMENGTISQEELMEMTAYVEKMEEFDTKKITALQEYAELKKQPIEQVMKELNPFNLKTSDSHTKSPQSATA